MTAAVVRETLRQTIRTARLAKSLPWSAGECPGIGWDPPCARFVFSCSSVECPRQLLCGRWRPGAAATETRLYDVRWTGTAWHHHAECITHQECWKCGTAIDPNREQYFCACGVVQPPIEKRSLFQVMGLDEERFDVDVKDLADRYRDLQRILHPDKYSQKSEKEKDFSIQHSSLVNRAYRMLAKPLTRGLYMLRLSEEDLEKETQIDLEFLDDVMEINEAIIEADSIETIVKLEIENQRVIDQLVRQISKAFEEDDKTLAKICLVKLKYYSNIDDKIKDFKVKITEW